MATLESRDDGVTVPLKRLEAAALAAVADVGLRASEALARIAHPATAEQALNAVRAARGAVTLKRPEAAALISVAGDGLALARAFSALAIDVDLAAAQRGLDELRGALR